MDCEFWRVNICRNEMRSAKRVREQPFSAHSMARKRQLMFFIFFRQSCATALTTAENAAHGVCHIVSPHNASLTRQTHRVCHIVPPHNAYAWSSDTQCVPYITHSGDFSIFFKKRLDRSETGCILNSSKQKCSIPFSGGVAQLVEQRTENPRVTSSILVLATIFFALMPDGDTPFGFFCACV